MLDIRGAHSKINKDRMRGVGERQIKAQLVVGQTRSRVADHAKGRVVHVVRHTVAIIVKVKNIGRQVVIGGGCVAVLTSFSNKGWINGSRTRNDIAQTGTFQRIDHAVAIGRGQAGSGTTVCRHR